MKKQTAKEFDDVSTMLDIRDLLSRHAKGPTAEEEKRLARERAAKEKRRQAPDKEFQAACMRKRRAGKRSVSKSPRV